MKIITNDLGADRMDRVQQIAPQANFVITTDLQHTLREIADADVIWGTG